MIITENTDDVMTLKQIQFVTGHETTDAVRMALKRANIKASGVRIQIPASWPPVKIYSSEQVWGSFAERIIRHAGEDEAVREACWAHFRPQIRQAMISPTVGVLFADKTE